MRKRSNKEEGRQMLLVSMPVEQAAELESLSNANAMEGSEFILLALENLMEYLENQGITQAPQAKAQEPPPFTYGEPEEPVLMAADIDGEPTDC